MLLQSEQIYVGEHEWRACERHIKLLTIPFPFSPYISCSVAAEILLWLSINYENVSNKNQRSRDVHRRTNAHDTPARSYIHFHFPL